MSILGLALTADNLTVILTGIEDKWKDIAQNLIVPKSEITRINNEHSNSTTEKLRSVFKYSLKMHPFSSWRSIIRSLDKAEEFVLADKIRPLAECITGKTVNE